MTEPAEQTDKPTPGRRRSSGASGAPGPSARRAVRILPWSPAEPAGPDLSHEPRSTGRRTPVPPSGLIAPGGVTGPSAAAAGVGRPVAVRPGTGGFGGPAGSGVGRPRTGFVEESPVAASSPWLPATQRSGPPPTSVPQPWAPARPETRGPRPVPAPPSSPDSVPSPPPRPERRFAAPPRRAFTPPTGWAAPAPPAPVPTTPVPTAPATPGPTAPGPTAPVPAAPVPAAPASAGSAPAGSGRAAPTADALRHEWIVTREREVPAFGWRAGLYAATGGMVNVGPGPAERARQEQAQRIRRPLAGSHQIAVTSIKGGIGKTTVAACLGLMLAEYRGDGVIVLDADPDAGTLADRLTGPPRSGIRALLANLERVDSLSGFGRHTSLAGRLRVLAGEQDPATGESFSDAEYERICSALTRFFDIVITDSGTGLVHSAMRGTLRVADRLVVVGAPTVDGASRASKTLDWLLAHGHGQLAEEAVLVLCQDRTSHKVDRDAIRDHFAQRCGHVVEIPADPHLRAGGVIDPARLAPATRDAYLELAALVADGFRPR